MTCRLSNDTRWTIIDTSSKTKLTNVGLLMLEKIFISKMNIKEQLKTSFLVKVMNLMEGRDGRPYLNIILSDASGDLEARMWGEDAVKTSKNIKKGRFVEAKGRLNLYQGRRQFIIQSLRAVEESEININDYFPKTEKNLDELYESLLNMVEQLDDFYIRELLKKILTDEKNIILLKKAVAAKTIHHAHAGGLLEHIHSCSKLALFLSDYYQVNKNYVLAGAILHDFCKINEMTCFPLVEYTDEGKLVGHLVKSVEVVDEYSRGIPNFPHDLKVHLNHVLLSHHGHLEFGSPKLPQTKEAYLVHLIDLMDSKMGAFDLIIKNDQTEGNWSQYIKHLDRVVFKAPLPHYPI